MKGNRKIYKVQRWIIMHKVDDVNERIVKGKVLLEIGVKGFGSFVLLTIIQTVLIPDNHLIFLFT